MVSSLLGTEPGVEGSVEKCDFEETWLSSDDAGGVDEGEGSSVGTSGELCTLRRNEPRLHH